MSLKKWEIAGIIFTCIVGTILHFVYEWSGNNPFVGIFAPINESTWEHLKLLFYPMLIFSIIEYYFIGKNYSNFICSKTIGIITGMFSIIAIFYTYSGILGKNYLVLDILTFIFGVCIAYIVSYYILTRCQCKFTNKENICIIVIFIIILLFIIFNYYPPNIGLFKNPLE